MVTKPPTNFSASDQRSRMVLDQIEKERAAADAKNREAQGAATGQGSGRQSSAAQHPAPAKPRRKRIT